VTTQLFFLLNKLSTPFIIIPSNHITSNIGAVLYGGPKHRLENSLARGGRARGGKRDWSRGGARGRRGGNGAKRRKLEHPIPPKE